MDIKTADYWTADENRRWIELTKIYGKNSRKIASIMGTRSLLQCARKVYVTFMKLQRGSLTWDKKLFDAVKPYNFEHY